MRFNDPDDFRAGQKRRAVKNRIHQILRGLNLSFAQSRLVQRRVWVNANTAEKEKNRPVQPIDTLQGLPQGLPVFVGATQQKIVGDVEAGLFSLPVGLKDIGGGKRLPEIRQHRVAKRLRAEFHVRKTGIRQLLKITFRGNGGSKKSSPGNGDAPVLESPGNLKAVFVTGVECGIGHKNIFGAGVLQPTGLMGDLPRVQQPHFAAFNVGIGAVTASKRASPFGLQIQHAAIRDIKFCVFGIGIKDPVQLSLPGEIANGRSFRGNHPRNRGRVPLLFQRIEEQRKPLPFSGNAEIRAERPEKFEGKHRVAAPAQNERRLRLHPDNADHVLIVGKETAGAHQVRVVDIAY